MIPVGKTGAGLSGCLRYVLSEGREKIVQPDGKTTSGPYLPKTANENESRVAWISGQGFGDWKPESRADAETMRRMMEFAAANQSTKHQCTKDVLHLVLSWRKVENPSRAEMEQAAKEALSAVGMSNARAIFVAHRDTDHAHLHIVASRINPETGLTYRDSYTKLKWQKWAREWDHSHGFEPFNSQEKRSQIQAAIEELKASVVLELMTQRQSTFTGNELDREINRVLGEEEAAAFRHEILTQGGIVALYDRISGEKLDRFTTLAVRSAEREALEHAAALVGSTRHKVSPEAADAALAKCPTMRDEQRRAFEHATGAEGLAIIDGKAGTGKSYTMDAIRAAYQADGYRVIGLAPTRRVVEKMQNDGFTEAKTLHKIILDLNNNKDTIHRRTVFMVDEAAMVGTRFYNELLIHTERVGAKVIFVGDDRQLTSIERGGMFTELREKFGAETLSFVTRQKNAEHKAISEMLSRGEFAEGVEALDKLGCINRSNHQSEAINALVEQWKKDTDERPEKTRLVFAYTNDLVLQLNAKLRDVRKERGELGADHEFTTKDGTQFFAENDRLIFNTSDARKGINNGTVGTITKIVDNKITLRVDGRLRQLTFDAREINAFRHGYASTIHKGQGDTTDEAALLHTFHWKEAAAYVALTRHRDTVKVFTSVEVAEDNAELARQLGRYEERRASLAFATQEEIREATAEAVTSRKAEQERERIEAAVKQEPERSAEDAATAQREQTPKPPEPERIDATTEKQEQQQAEQLRRKTEREQTPEPPKSPERERIEAAAKIEAEQQPREQQPRAEDVTREKAERNRPRRSPRKTRPRGPRKAGRHRTPRQRREQPEQPREQLQRAAEDVTREKAEPEPERSAEDAATAQREQTAEQPEPERIETATKHEAEQQPREQLQRAAEDVTREKAEPEPPAPIPATDAPARAEEGRKAPDATAAPEQTEQQQEQLQRAAEEVTGRKAEQSHEPPPSAPTPPPATPTKTPERPDQPAASTRAKGGAATRSEDDTKAPEATAAPKQPEPQAERPAPTAEREPTPEATAPAAHQKAEDAPAATPAPTLAATVEKPAAVKLAQPTTAPTAEREQQPEKVATPARDVQAADRHDDQPTRYDHTATAAHQKAEDRPAPTSAPTLAATAEKPAAAKLAQPTTAQTLIMQRTNQQQAALTKARALMPSPTPSTVHPVAGVVNASEAVLKTAAKNLDGFLDFFLGTEEKPLPNPEKIAFEATRAEAAQAERLKAVIEHMRQNRERDEHEKQQDHDYTNGRERKR